MKAGRSTAARVLLALLFLLFALNVASHVVTDALCCADDASFPVAAKNVAKGYGYQIDGLTGLGGMEGTAALGTGPALILPVSLAILGFGNRDWVPGATTALLVFGLLLLLHRRGRYLAVGAPEWPIACIAFLVLCNLVTVRHYEQWYAMLGEIPCALLVLLGLVLLAEEPLARVHALLAGILLGLAIQTKLVALLAVAAACLCLS